LNNIFYYIYFLIYFIYYLYIIYLYKYSKISPNSLLFEKMLYLKLNIKNWLLLIKTKKLKKKKKTILYIKGSLKF